MMRYFTSIDFLLLANDLEDSKGSSKLRAIHGAEEELARRGRLAGAAF
jgi:hypothetical protein